MLLWVLILALFGAMVALFGGNLPDRLKALVLAVQGWIGAAFLLFILFTSNPFSASTRRRSKGATSTRSCRTSGSPSIRRSSISAMSALDRRSPLPSPR
jgi:hypothetical protein